MRIPLILVALTLAFGCGGGDDGDSSGPSAAERLWVVATKGFASPATLLFSDDDGRRWRTAFASAHELRGLAFTGDGHGAAVGSGIALFTRDGGAHWSTSREVANERLAAVAFREDGRGIAIGGAVRSEEFDRVPLVLATEDGGAHWDVDALPDGVGDVMGVLAGTCFTKSGVAIVIASFPTLILRRDAAGWIDVTPPSPGILSGIACIGETVWVSGTTLMRSHDSGFTWRDRTGELGEPGFFADRVAFADDLHGWILGTLPVRTTPNTTLNAALRVFGTSDGGVTWQGLPIGDLPIGHWDGVGATTAGGPHALAGATSFSSESGPIALALDDAEGRRLALPAGFDGVVAVTISPR